MSDNPNLVGTIVGLIDVSHATPDDLRAVVDELEFRIAKSGGENQ